MPWTRLVDLALDDEEKADMLAPYPMPEPPEYPPGLRICFGDSELKKLDLEEDPEIGDVIDIRAFACVTSFSKIDGKRRVELQIEKIAIEDEADEEPGDDE